MWFQTSVKARVSFSKHQQLCKVAIKISWNPVFVSFMQISLSSKDWRYTNSFNTKEHVTDICSRSIGTLWFSELANTNTKHIGQ